MALRRCLRTDFLLGFRHQIADTLDGAGIELLGPSIGDQPPFDKALSDRPGDGCDQRPSYMRAPAPIASPLTILPPFSLSSNSAIAASVV
jgi:hypothetical protein